MTEHPSIDLAPSEPTTDSTPPAPATDIPSEPATDAPAPAELATADALESAATTEQVTTQTPEPADDTSASADGDAPFGEEEGVLSDVEVVVDDETMRRALEAILMVTDEPLPVLTLARTVGRPTGDVTNALSELAGEYTEQGRGFDLREVGGGWRYYTRADAAQYVERFVLDGQQSRLTQAALETLAVVAYKQPVSRARVSAIRGVNVDGVMRTLVSRGLVEEAGADTESQATLYRTTSYFLERMGMQSLDDLPELAPYLPEMDDMEEELAAQNTPTTEPTPDAEPAAADEDPVRADGDLAGDEVREEQAVAEGRDEELEPAEELEAGGEELEPDVDPAEIPSGEEDADGNDEDADSNDLGDEDGDDDDIDGDGPADFDAATGDSDDLDLIDDDEDEDDLDEDDESADERLEAAEDLEAAGAPDGIDEQPVAGGSQYGTEPDPTETEANDRNE